MSDIVHVVVGHGSREIRQRDHFQAGVVDEVSLADRNRVENDLSRVSRVVTGNETMEIVEPERRAKGRDHQLDVMRT